MTESKPSRIPAADYLASQGNPDATNVTLTEDIDQRPKAQRLEVLAGAYELKALRLDQMSDYATQEVIDTYLVPQWELEAVGARAIATHLRSLAQEKASSS